MMQWGVETRWLASALVFAMAFPTIHAADDAATGSLSGVIRGADRSPLAGARLFAVDPDSGESIASEPTSEDGNFTLSGLASGPYELAVGVGDTLYLVESSVYVVGGVDRQVQIAIDPAGADAAVSRVELPFSWRNNPLVAAFIVFSAAVVVGVLVENATEDEVDTTHANP